MQDSSRVRVCCLKKHGTFRTALPGTNHRNHAGIRNIFRPLGFVDKMARSGEGLENFSHPVNPKP